MRHYDFAIIGSGPGGSTAAKIAAGHQSRVALIEKGPLGGVSLHDGCIPIKSLVVSSKMQYHAMHGEDYGLDVSVGPSKLPHWINRQREVIAKLAQELDQSLRSHGVDVIEGTAMFENHETLRIRNGVGEELITARKIIIATGAQPVRLETMPHDNAVFGTSNHYLHRTQVPPSLTIIGGSYIACELACIYRALGTKVTLIEAQPNILPEVDPEAGRYLRDRFQTLGIVVRTDTEVTHATLSDDGNTGILTLNDDERIEAEHVLVAVGRQPDLSNLGLDRAGIEYDDHILVNTSLQTNVPNIYAVGDCNQQPALAHAARCEAETATLHALGEPRRMDYSCLPFCVYTIPEITVVGTTKEEAESQGIRTIVGRCSFRSVGRAVALGELEGFLKITAREDDHKIIGALMICIEASELAAQLTLAIKLGATVDQIAEVPFPHPTLSEAFQEAARRALNSGYFEN